MTDPASLRPLLVACRKGRDDAARALWEALAGTLTAYARSVLREPGLAEDAVQNAMLRFMSRPVREVRSVEDPRAWLVTIVRREALTMLRSATRRRHRDRFAGEGIAETSILGVGDFDRSIDDAVRRLPRHEREVVTLRHVAGMTYEQIGLALGVNPNTVASRHRSAVARLRERITPGGDVGASTQRQPEGALRETLP